MTEKKITPVDPASTTPVPPGDDAIEAGRKTNILRVGRKTASFRGGRKTARKTNGFHGI